jgi:aspartyl-tRNA(Asn)/glutamyl-tRNA(Gln) amidotransferase subunit A
MARSARDVALMLGAMAGFDPRDPNSLDVPVDDWSELLALGAKGLRIGLPTNWFGDRCHPDVLEAYGDCAEALRDAGAVLVDVDLPNVHLAEAMCWTIMLAEVSSLHEINFDRLDEYDDAFSERLVNGHFVTARDYLRALRLRPLVQADFEAAMEKVDVILTPGSPTTAPRLDEMLVDVGDGPTVPWLDVAARCTMPFNITGMPALSFPTGFSAGLPVGAQVVAAPLREDLCLRVAAAFQLATDVHRQAPVALV